MENEAKGQVVGQHPANSSSMLSKPHPLLADKVTDTIPNAQLPQISAGGSTCAQSGSQQSLMSGVLYSVGAGGQQPQHPQPQTASGGGGSTQQPASHLAASFCSQTMQEKDLPPLSWLVLGPLLLSHFLSLEKVGLVIHCMLS